MFDKYKMYRKISALQSSLENETDQLQKSVYPSASHAFVECMGGYSIDVVADDESPLLSSTLFRLGKDQAATLVD